MFNHPSTVNCDVLNVLEYGTLIYPVFAASKQMDMSEGTPPKVIDIYTISQVSVPAC
jgi:hypothetical protein